MTPQERRLWYDFLRKYPHKFYKQRIIDNYIVDFYCAKVKLVIELDGSQHYTADGQEYDKIRTDVLEKYDLHVMRFSNLEINRSFSAVCEKIDAYVRGENV